MSDKSENLNIPGTSVDKEQEPEDDSLHSEASKRRLKTALDLCLHHLTQEDLITSESSTVITEEHIQMANKIHQKILEVLSEYTFVCDVELIRFEDVDEEGEYAEVKGGIASGDDYESDAKKMKEDPESVPLDYKIMAVNLAKTHPKWKLKSLQTKGASRLKHMRDLKIWEDHIKKGGTRNDKYHTIDSWTYDRFVEARSCNQQVTTRNLQQWALAAASQFPDLEFKASGTWVKEFKQRHKIRQRKITKYVSERETATIEETLAVAENFRRQTRALIPKYDKDFVINTDQTGKQYVLSVYVKRKTLWNVTYNRFTFVSSLSRLPVSVDV